MHMIYKIFSYFLYIFFAYPGLTTVTASAQEFPMIVPRQFMHKAVFFLHHPENRQTVFPAKYTQKIPPESQWFPQAVRYRKTPYRTDATVPYAITGPAMINIFAPVPGTRPSLLNSIAGDATAFAKPVIGTSVPAPANFAILS